MTPATGHFSLTRTIATGPDRLWHLLTDARSREMWAVPSDGHMLVADTIDLQEDGYEMHRCGPAEAPEYQIATRWYRLQAPDGACFTETLIMGGARIATTLVSYALAPEDGATTLTVDVSVCSFVGPEATGEFKAGWESGLSRLEALIGKGALQ